MIYWYIDNHCDFTYNANPKPYPTAIANAPNNNDYRPERNLFNPTNIALANPKLNSYTPPTIIAIIA